MNKLISIVIPTFNEEGNIVELHERLLKVLPEEHELIFVDDGSSDNGLELIKQLSERDKRVKYIEFSRNFGHQAALKAGLQKASGACAISLDADLQHPPELIPELLKKWEEGYEVVYTIRNDKDSDESLFKKVTSKYFYKLMNKLSTIEIKIGAADFRLLDRKVLDVVNRINEKDLFFRGLISWVGFKQAEVIYTPAMRKWGESKYSLKKMILFAISGITAFSTKPLVFSIGLGLVISMFSFLYFIYVLFIKFFTNEAISGWSSLLCSILFIGGVQLIVLGVIGQYIGKLFIEIKNRPNFIIRDEN